MVILLYFANGFHVHLNMSLTELLLEITSAKKFKVQIWAALISHFLSFLLRYPYLHDLPTPQYLNYQNNLPCLFFKLTFLTFSSVLILFFLRSPYSQSKFVVFSVEEKFFL